MEQRPILFKGDMVNAILRGDKTQTRRVIKGDTDHQWDSLEGYSSQWVNPEKGDHWILKHSTKNSSENYIVKCPSGKVGDQLWVRETCFFDSIFDHLKTSEIPKGESVGYIATGMIHTRKGKAILKNGKTRPSIFMPRWASRIQLEITDIRIERLNDISEEDAKAEGVEELEMSGSRNIWRFYLAKPDQCVGVTNARQSFMSLWESIYDEGSWYENPWVWVVEFKRVEL